MPYTDDDRERSTETHTMMKVVVEKVTDHENRLRKVEGVQLKAIGALGLLTLGLNTVAGWFHR